MTAGKPQLTVTGPNGLHTSQSAKPVCNPLTDKSPEPMRKKPSCLVQIEVMRGSSGGLADIVGLRAVDVVGRTADHDQVKMRGSLRLVIIDDLWKTIHGLFHVVTVRMQPDSAPTELDCSRKVLLRLDLGVGCLCDVEFGSV